MANNPLWFRCSLSHLNSSPLSQKESQCPINLHYSLLQRFHSHVLNLQIKYCFPHVVQVHKFVLQNLKPAVTYVIGPYVDHDQWIPLCFGQELVHALQAIWYLGTRQAPCENPFCMHRLCCLHLEQLSPPLPSTLFSWRMWPSGYPEAHQSSHSQGQGPGPIPARDGIGWTPPPLEMPLCGVHALSFACAQLSPNSPASSEVPQRTCYEVPRILPILSYATGQQAGLPDPGSCSEDGQKADNVETNVCWKSLSSRAIILHPLYCFGHIFSPNYLLPSPWIKSCCPNRETKSTV